MGSAVGRAATLHRSMTGQQAATDDFEPIAASAVRELGHLLSRRRVSAELADEIVATVAVLVERLEAAPYRDKHTDLVSHGRYGTFIRTGELPPPIEDGEVIPFDRASIVGGSANPFGTGATHRRDGDESVTTVTFGPAFEGPAGRVHGGAVALVVDESTATVLPMLGRFGFTGSVNLRLVAPAPLGTEVTFRSRLDREEGRKLFVRCVGAGPEGSFVEAEAIYVQVDPTTVPWIADARRRWLDGEDEPAATA